MGRKPLYPHVPKGSKPIRGDRLRFLPDSPEVLAQTVAATGYRDKLASVFCEAIARAKGGR